MAQNWTKADLGPVGSVPRTELKEKLNLSGCEVSVNRLEPGQALPFVHKHRLNEELYLVLAGQGEFWLDGEVVPLGEGDAVKVLPETGRCLRAGAEAALTYLCIQAAAGSLGPYTRTDGVIVDQRTGW